MKKNRVVFYARVSTQEEEQVSALKEQVNELEDFINQNEDWILVEKYIDEGKSGTTIKGRNAYQRLLEDIEENKFDIIVVKDESRLNRNVLNYYQFIDRLVQNQKKLYFYLEKKYYESDQALINGIKAIMAQEYSRDLSKKINNAHKQRQKKGKVCTNSRIMGYDLVDGQLVINEKEAEVVRCIYKEYILGKGFRTIALNLFDKGIKSNNDTLIQATTLKRILSNEKYKGTLVSNKLHLDFDTKKKFNVPEEQWIIKENAVPAIVSEEIWEKANSILESKKFTLEDGKKVGRNHGKYALSGKVICGTCGKTYVFVKRNNCKNDIWQCVKNRQFGATEHGCTNKFKIAYDDLNNIIKEIIKHYWDTREKNIERVIQTLDNTMQQTELSSTDNLIQQKEKLKSKKEKLIDALTEGLITKDEFIIQKHTLDGSLNSIEEKINEIVNQNNSLVDKKERLVKIQESYKNKSDIQIINDDIINQVIKQIVISETPQIDIYFNEEIPISEGKFYFDINNYKNVVVNAYK